MVIGHVYVVCLWHRHNTDTKMTKWGKYMADDMAHGNAMSYDK